MATKIRLMRLGKMRQPYYRVVVADARTKRQGRVIETLGKYHPKQEPSYIEVDSERVQHWLSVGAQPTEPVAAILRATGDWQRFKGLPAPEPLKTGAPAADRRAVFEAAAREGAGEPAAEATTGRTRPSRSRGGATPRTGTAGDRQPSEQTIDAPGQTEPTEAATPGAETTATPAQPGPAASDERDTAAQPSGRTAGDGDTAAPPGGPTADGDRTA